MAKVNRFTVLDISSECIRYAVVSCDPSGAVCIEDARSAVIEPGVSTGMSQDALIAITLKRLLAGVKPVSRRTVIAVEGASVFSRLVRLPPVAADQVQQTIRHEAVQNIPFPLDEVVWDAHIIDPDVREPEVLLAAAKSDVVAGLVHAVAANGLRVDRVVPAQAALADAVRYDYPDADSLLLVSVVSGAANLVFVDGSRTFFRTIPSVGEDEDRLVAELERSIVFYGSQQGGRAPEKILLAEAEGIEIGTLAERLSIPVQEFRSSCLGGMGDQASAVTAGLAVHCNLKRRVDLNLLPVVLQDERNRRRRLSLYLASAVLAILLAGLWGWYLNALAGLRHQDNIEMSNAVAALSELERQLIPVEEKTAQLKRDFDVYFDAVQKRAFWLETLRDIDALLPEGMFLLSSEPLRNDGVFEGLRITVVSYLDKETPGQDAVKILRDSFRESDRFNRRCSISSRPSKQLFARSFVMDLFFEEVL